MERGLAVLARSVTALALLGAVAQAAPKKKDAKAAFDKGVAAYNKNDYAKASENLGKSFALEEDTDTLFAWAQTEKKLGHCEKAIKLYENLLAMNMPDANRKAVGTQIEECRALILAETRGDPLPSEPVAAPEPEPAREAPPSRWNSPAGLALVGAGIVGVGLGTVFLVQAKGAEDDQASAVTYGDYVDLGDKARSRGTLGWIVGGAGAACLVGGIVYIATRHPERSTQVSVSVTPEWTGVLALGRF